MIRLFVGTSAGEDLEAQCVLEYTVNKYASEPVEITWMHQAKTGLLSDIRCKRCGGLKGSHPTLQDWKSVKFQDRCEEFIEAEGFCGWNTGSWATPFTGFRWGIPAACGYTGRAIYTDVDFFFRADIAELWDQEIPGVLLLHHTTGKLRTCCILFDCEKTERHFPTIAELRNMPDPNGHMRAELAGNPQMMSPFAGDWNCIDGKGYQDLNDPAIKAIHYSYMSTQPHLKYAIPRLALEGRTHWYDGELAPHWRPDLVALWEQEYAAALAAGYTPERYHVEPFGPYKKKSWKDYKPKDRSSLTT